MTTLVLSFREPAQQLNMNQRMHHMQRARLVKVWRYAAKLAAVDAINRGRTERNLPRSLVQLSLPTTRPGGRRDPSNFSMTTKCVVDGMTDAGLWVDDDANHVVTLEPRFHLAAPERWVRVAVQPVEGGMRLDGLWDGAA